MTSAGSGRRRLEEEERGEELKERLEREHNELLQELRSLIPGAEVLLGFLLAISFTGEFGELGDAQRYVYYGTLLATGIALVLFLAPAAHHRIRFRAADKEYALGKANREAIAGTVATSLALTGVIYLVSDRAFGEAEAIAAAAVFWAFVAWRWWLYGVVRAWRDRAA